MPFIPFLTIIRLLFRHRWARVAFVPAATLGLTIGGIMVVGRAHPAHPVAVDGKLLQYSIQSRYLIETGRDVVIAQEPTHRYHLIGSYTPPLPDRIPSGSAVTLYVDQGTDDVLGISAQDSRSTGRGTYQTAYIGNPDQLRTDRLVGGIGILVVPVAMLGFIGYAAFFYKPATRENQARKAETAARGDYGPMTAHMAGFLRGLSGLSEEDWRQVGQMGVAQRLTGTPPATRHAAQRLREAADAANRTNVVRAAQEAAERVVRAHPPIKDLTGMDLRSYMATPAALAAAAVAAGDLIGREDFNALYEMMAAFIPAESLLGTAPAAPAMAAAAVAPAT